MALEMTGEYVLPLDRAAVYAALNDAEMLKRCIPGCEQLEKLSDTEFAAVARIEVGPVKARFKGKVRLLDLDPPQGYRIAGEGEGGVAGFAKGHAAVTLVEVAEGTRLSYKAEAQVGGKLAQLGQRLLAGAAKKIADKFFANFAAALGGQSKA
jgi:carbon monoxide dehydrogenase subunit G